MTSDEFNEIEFSHRQPPWHVLVLGIFTLLAYLPFWFYKTIKALKKEGLLENVVLKKVPPALLAFTMILPIINIFTAASVFNECLNLNPDKNYPLKRNVGLASLMLAMFMSLLFPLSKGEGPQVLAFVLGVLPVALCQQWLNAYWSTKEKETVIYREAFSVTELLVIIVGSLIFGLIVFNFMIEKAG